MADEKTDATVEETKTDDVEEQSEASQEEVEEKESKPQAQEKVYTKKDFDKQAYAIRRKDKENKELKAKVFEYEKQLKSFEALKAENVELKAEKQCNAWKKDIGKEFNIPADVLRGNSEDEIRSHAESLKESGFGNFNTSLGDNSHAEPTKQDGSLHGQFAEAIRDFKNNR